MLAVYNFKKVGINMIIIADYSRKSVYSDKSDSTQAQYNLALEYCKSHYENFELIRYEDEGFSGANTNRPAFSRMTDDIKDGKINIVICYKIDRVSRDVKDFSNFFSFLQEHNVEFVSIKEQLDTSTPLGRAMMYICSVFAQMERETIAERVKDGMTELSKSGRWAGGCAPLGYKRERVEICGKFHTVLKPDEQGIKLLNLISDIFLNNNYTLNKLEKYCRDNKITTIRGSYFSKTQIYSVLKNPIYCTADQAAYDYFEELGCKMGVERNKFDGTYAIMPYGRTEGGKRKKHIANPPEKWIISVGLHTPLWSSEKYIAIQKRFGNNQIDKTRKHKIGILKGIVRCKCGYLMRVQHKVDKASNKIYDNYFCTLRSHQGKDFCDMPFTSVSTLDNAVINILKQIKLDKSMIDNFIVDDRKISIVYRSRSDVQHDIDMVNRKILNLTNALGNATGSNAAKYIVKEIESLDKKLSELNYELLEISNNEKKQTHAKYDKEAKYKLICDIVDSLDTLGYDEINSLLKELFKECIYDGQTLHIKL